MNRKGILIWAVILISLSVNSCKQDPDIDYQPLQTYPWDGSGYGFATWGCGGLYMYGSSASEPRIFDLWKWENTTLKKKKTCTLDKDNTEPTGLTDRLFLVGLLNQYKSAIKNADTNMKEKEWSLGDGWYIDQTGLSRSGKYGVICTYEDYTHKPEGYDREHPRVRLGLIEIVKT